MPQATTASTTVSRPVLLVIGATVGGLVALTLALWMYYGTAVFHEIILAGFAACF